MFPKEDHLNQLVKWLCFIFGLVGTANFFIVVGGRVKETDYLALAICLAFTAFGFGFYFFFRRLREKDLEFYQRQLLEQGAGLLVRSAFEPALWALVNTYADLGPEKGKKSLTNLVQSVIAIATSYEHLGGRINDAKMEAVVKHVAGKISGLNFGKLGQDIDVTLIYRTVGDGLGVPYENRVSIHISGGGYQGAFEATGQVQIK